MPKSLREFTNFVDLLFFLALTEPDQIACTFLTQGGKREINGTYLEIAQQAKIIAALLQERGVRTGDRIVLLYPPGLEFIQSLFGCFYAGAIAVPLYPPINAALRSKLELVVSNCKPKFVLADKSTLSLLLKFANKSILAKCMITDNVDTQLIHEWHKSKIKPEQIAILQYTSGSTGDPKGVMVSHGNLMANERIIYASFNHDRLGVGVNWLPPYHDMGLVGSILQGFYCNRRTILMSPVQFLANPAAWLQAITDYKAHTSGGPNFGYAYCVQQITEQQCQTLDLCSWKIAFNGAEPNNPQVIEAFTEKFSPFGFQRSAFLPCYGLAEATLFVSGSTSKKGPTILTIANKNNSSTSSSTQQIVSCGKPAQAIKIVNPTTKVECASKEVGEIWITGPSVTQGYWGKAALSRATFKAKLKNDNHTTYLRTGDLGFIDAGELYVTSRIKDLIIIDGINYYPQDIENTLYNSYPKLPTSYVTAFSISYAGSEKLIILIGIAKSKLPHYSNLLKHMAQKIFSAHHLAPWKMVLTLPSGILKTTTGKVRRHACKEAFIANELPVLEIWESADVPSLLIEMPDIKTVPQTVTEMEDLLKLYIAAYLKTEPSSLSSSEPLAIYGLNSLVALRIAAQLSQILNREISPILVYEYQTIAELAHYLILEEEPQELCTNAHKMPHFEPIAIIGMACNFPGNANSPEAFWKLLAEGRDGISQIPASRWDKSAFYDSDPQTLGTMCTTKGGFIKNVDQFDAAFFGISPQEANYMDPQQRLLLETTWKALENSGINPKSLANSLSGVYIGISNNDYMRLLHTPADYQPINPYEATGNSAASCSGRISYFLGLHGPSVSIDTACSSSLVAADIACNHLHLRQCDTAIVGGTNLILDPYTSIMLSQARMLSAHGHCQVFDAGADGYVRSEGCGVVILKRLDSAIQDGDPILAVIRASAVNQDGYSQGFTAPNRRAQTALIKQALQRAQLAPNDIDYIEAHGTGTQLGDPIEMTALSAVFSQEQKRKHPLIVGAVKSNIGHLESAAGIASLIKVTLALQAQAIPPNLHFKRCNPLINLSTIPAVIPTELTTWKKYKQPRRAGINSFGFTGTNAHLIIEEAPKLKNSPRKTSIVPHKFKHTSYWVNTPIKHTTTTPIRTYLLPILEKKLKELLQDSHFKTETNVFAEFCLYYIAQALLKIANQTNIDTLKTLTVFSLIVSPKQEKLLKHLLNLIQSQDIDTSILTKAPDVDKLCTQHPDAELEIRLAQRCGEHLAEVLTGKINPLILLFPRDSLFTAERLYLDSLYTKIVNNIVQQAIATLLAKHFSGRKDIKILEIGAGTGGTTHHVLPVLADKIIDYCFTDISSFFLDTAKVKFSQHPIVRYQLLDIERSPLEQGFYPDEFDIIIAANVLHATQDIQQTLTHMHSILAASGIVLLVESTQPSAWLDITFGLLEGWWRFKDHTLRPNYPLLTMDKWSEVLAKTNYTNVTSITCPADTHQTLIIASTSKEKTALPKSPIAIRTNTYSPSKLSAFAVELQALLKEADHSNYVPIIKQQLTKYIAEMTHRTLEQVQENLDFREMGIDSLMAIELFNNLQRAMGPSVILLQSTMLEHNTIKTLAEYMVKAIDTSKISEQNPNKDITNNEAVVFPSFKFKKDK